MAAGALKAAIEHELTVQYLETVRYKFNTPETFGDESEDMMVQGYAEATLETNPVLSSAGMILPLDAVVILPEFVVISGQAQVERLWDE